jgi:hypothetical protein
MVYASFFCKDTFLITGRGLVFAGTLVSGDFERGDMIIIKKDDMILEREIIGIEGIRHRSDNNIFGIQIKCESKEEQKTIRAWELKDIQFEIVKKT